MTLPQPLVDLLNNPPPGFADAEDLATFHETLSRASGMSSEPDTTPDDQPSEGSTPRPRED
jgi:hypothetical protein